MGGAGRGGAGGPGPAPAGTVASERGLSAQQPPAPVGAAGRHAQRGGEGPEAGPAPSCRPKRNRLLQALCSSSCSEEDSPMGGAGRGGAGGPGPAPAGTVASERGLSAQQPSALCHPLCHKEAARWLQPLAVQWEELAQGDELALHEQLLQEAEAMRRQCELHQESQLGRGQRLQHGATQEAPPSPSSSGSGPLYELALARMATEWSRNPAYMV